MKQQAALREWSAACAQKVAVLKQVEQRLAKLRAARDVMATECADLESKQARSQDLAHSCLDKLRKCAPASPSHCILAVH